MDVTAALLRKRIDKGIAALQHPAYRRALRHRILPAIEHEPVLAQLPGVGDVVDVGANVGQFAIVARRLWPDAHIISFEPLPAAGRRLEHLFHGDARFEKASIALSDTEGPQALHITEADDSSSLLSSAPRQVEEFPGTRGVATLNVQVSRLDTVLAGRPALHGPVLLKLDTQGTELAVLKGGTTFLERVTYVVVEASFVELYVGQAWATDLVEYLLQHGFALRSVYDVKVSRHLREPIQADFLFERRSA